MSSLPTLVRRHAHWRRVARIAISSTLVIRNVALFRSGGGVTPMRLLQAETLAFALAAVTSIAVVPRWCGGGGRVRRVAVVSWWVGVATHGIRLAIYLSR